MVTRLYIIGLCFIANAAFGNDFVVYPASCVAVKESCKLQTKISWDHDSELCLFLSDSEEISLKCANKVTDYQVTIEISAPQQFLLKNKETGELLAKQVVLPLYQFTPPRRRRKHEWSVF